MKVLLAGATGLVGQLLLDRLTSDQRVSRIDCLLRRPLDDAAKSVAEHVAPVAHWPHLVAELGADVAISTLGTTMKQAGSEAAFAAVDHEAVLAFARAAAASGTRHFMMVSSVGAHPASRNFYLRTKGQAEADVQQIGFERVDIFRPGLLRGQRGGERRIGERLAIMLSPVTDLLTPHVLDHYRSIAAEDVARAMHAAMSEISLGTHFHDNRTMLSRASG